MTNETTKKELDIFTKEEAIAWAKEWEEVRQIVLKKPHLLDIEIVAGNNFEPAVTC